MINEASYWVAAHLTGLFQIRDEDPEVLRRGSRGAGLSINRGVNTIITKIKSPRIKYFFDGNEIHKKEAIVSSKVIELLLPEKQQKNVRIIHRFEIPVSAGYGASAAGAIGTAFALNDLFELGLKKLELFQVAHKAEVITKSGLGDIIALYQGGLELRLKEGAPGFGETKSLIDSNDWNVATVYLGALKTPIILSDPQKRKAINDAADSILQNLISNPTLDNFISCSKEFTEKANLWSSRLKQYITSLPKGIIGSQIMLGESFFLFYRNFNDILQSNIPHHLITKEAICQNTVVKC